MGSGYKTDKDRFLAVLSVNLLIFIAELVIGYSSGSLSMISDSSHVFFDVVASLIALVSVTGLFGFNSKKLRERAALANVLLFFPVSLMIAREATERWVNPPIVDVDFWFFLTAFIGLAGNFYCTSVLEKHVHEKYSENKRGLFWHMAMDTIGSILVIISGIAMAWKGYYLSDPIVSIILACLIFILAVWLLVTGRKYGHYHKH